MCLLFYYINENANLNEYRLILVNVRDEVYSRPTRLCGYWDQYSSILGAQDILPGREGGTWIALNKMNGKIGAILNILEPVNNKKGRGHLVTDYLLSDENPQEYLDNLNKSPIDFNGFLLITIQVNSKINTCYYSNKNDLNVHHSSNGVSAFGNSFDRDNPWPKVTYGKEKFVKIIDKHENTSTKEELIKDLFEMLYDRTRFPVTEQMLEQGKGKSIDFLKRLSSIFVEIPEADYGSRTWTIILIDNDNNVDYIEKTLREPLIWCDFDYLNPEWITNRFNLKL